MANSRLCSIPDCGKEHRHRGYCDMHYRRLLRHGDPFGGRATFRGTVPTWVAQHLDYDGPECLIWPFGRSENGYGSCRINGSVQNASRYICALVHGEPPTPAHEAAHSCGKGHEGCVHPKHLRWDTTSGNQSDKLVHETLVRGTSVHNAKLDEEKVRFIRMNENTLTRTEMARSLSVTVAAVSAVVLRKNWAWVR